MAGGGVDEVVPGDAHPFSLPDIFQALLEKFKMAGQHTHGILTADVAVEQEVVHLNGGDALALGCERGEQAGHDLGLAGGGWPGQCYQNWSSTGTDQFDNTIDERLVDLGVGMTEFSVADFL